MSTPTAAVPRSTSRIIGVALVVLALGAVVYGVVREARKGLLTGTSPTSTAQSQPAPTGSTASAADPTSPEGASITTVYYFHGNVRCGTCRSIETQTRDTVQSVFSKDIAAGRLRFLAVNYDTPENQHFRDDFDLSFGSVIVSRGARFENLSDVWTLVDEQRSEFDAYLVDHVAQFSKAAP